VHGHPVSPLESVKRFLSRLKTAGVGRKILWGNDLAKRYSVFKELLLTAFAWAIVKEFEMRCKVRCHNGAVEIIEPRARERVWRTGDARSAIPWLSADECAPFENRERWGSLSCSGASKKLKGAPAPLINPHRGAQRW
jgi:hypothetical protein